MKTITIEVDEAEFKALYEGDKSYILTKKAVRVNQPVFIHWEDEEQRFEAAHVHTEPGLRQDWSIVALRPTLPPGQGSGHRSIDFAFDEPEINLAAGTFDQPTP